MNVVMTSTDGFVEIQGTAEDGIFTGGQATEMLALAQKGIKELIALQLQALAD